MSEKVLKEIADQLLGQFQRVCDGDVSKCGCMRAGKIKDPFKSCMVWAPLIAKVDQLDLKSTADLQAIYSCIARNRSISVDKVKSFLEAYLEHELEEHPGGTKSVAREKWERLLKVSKKIKF